MKITSFFSNRSLRFKIMSSVSLIVVIMLISLYVSMSINRYSQDILTGSYESNAVLNDFSNELAEVEQALETYVNYRTFESIDAYYNGCVQVENYLENFQKLPNEEPVLQKEYIVRQLALSFISFSGKAISSRRANSPDDTYYNKSLSCYKVLLNEITALNILLMNHNAGMFMENTESINKITTWSILFFAGFFALILLILYSLVTRIVQPLSEISNVAIRVSKRDFDVPLFNRTTSDEIGNICRAFDRMIVSIKEYINTIWEKARTENQLREREMQMKALYADAQLKAYQSQINPHFLFNTLNTGAQLAMMEGADKTCNFIEQTSDFFRYNIQSNKQEATISEELGLVDNFVYIMKVRFGKRLEFEKNVPDLRFSQLIPVMTLQPLVENCIKHGLQNTTGKVMLKVEEKDGFVQIFVSDNGCGMDETVRSEVLEKARADEIQALSRTDSEKHTGIGLINVFSRLRLYYHRDDIFDIMKGPEGTGTTFLIKVPANV